MNKEEPQFINLEIPKEIYAHQSDPLPDNHVVYSTSSFELTKDKGIIRHVDGALHPAKGIPTPSAIFALNQLKFILKEAITNYPVFLSTAFLINPNKTLQTFNHIADKLLLPYRINKKHMCPTAFYTYSTLSNALRSSHITPSIAEETAFNIAQIFEYDDAYRYRLQDMATELNIIKAKQSPRKEIKRLLSLHAEREDNPVIRNKIHKLILPITYLLLIPRYKKAFTSSISFLKGAKYDEADWYWTALRDDYLYGGKTQEERLEGRQKPPLYEINYK